MPRKKPSAPTPLDLLFMLADSCMHRLSPNAWKVVCYVAARHLRVNCEWLESIRNPALFALHRDLEKVGFLEPSGESGAHPYRPGGPAVPGEPVGRFAVISLQELCAGRRIKRRRIDFGTGLSKSSVSKAVNEAIGSGILVRETQKSANGRDLPSGYGINWDRVQENDWARRKGRKLVSG